MEARPVSHPPQDVLLALGAGKLDDATAEAIFFHVESCPECLKTAGRQSNDSFLDKLRAARGANSTPEPTKGFSTFPSAANSAFVLTTSERPSPTILPELRDHPQYEVLRELGRGGMGVVYLAKNKLMDRPEVLKVVNKQLLGDAGATERFLREIRSAAQLIHPNIVTAFSALQIGDLLLFSMEYIEGRDLAEVVKARGPLPAAHSGSYVLQAARGLQHAFEKGMVHRDIKPQNLILDAKKNIVKILDFGLAKAARTTAEPPRPGLTGLNMMMGTPDYMAPEQACDATNVDIRADIYSLGCTLYCLLAGRAPFVGGSLAAKIAAHQLSEPDPIESLRQDLPPGLAEIVRKMMAKDPAQRYQKPDDVVQALTVCFKGLGKRPTAKGAPAKVVTAKPVTASQLSIKRENKSIFKKATIAPVAAPRQTMMERPSPVARLKHEVPAPQWKKWLTAAGTAVAAMLMGLLVLGAAGVFKVKTADGVLVVNVNEPNAEVFVDGDRVTVTWSDGGKKAEIHVKPGTREVEVKKDGFGVDGRELTFKDGGREIFNARLLPNTAKPNSPQVAGAPDDDKGFVQMFNGKDLEGWAPPGPGAKSEDKWHVQNGVLIGTCAPYDILVSKDSYKDFHLRAEVQINDGGAGSIIVRNRVRPVSATGSRWQGYSVQINSPSWGTTGSLAIFRNTNEDEVVREVKLASVKPDHWFTLEVIAEGAHFSVKVNGEAANDWNDPESRFADGQISVRAVLPDTIINFRKIEIKELPAADAAAPPVPNIKKPDSPPVIGATDDDKDLVVDRAAIQVLQGHTGEVWQVAFSPDGKHLLSGSNSHFSVPDPVHRVTNNYPGTDNTVRMWEVETGRQVTVLGGHAWMVMGLAYCPKDSNLAAACSSTDWATDYADPRVVVYNLKSGEIRNSFRLPPRPAMRGIALSADGKRVIVCRGNSTLEAWDLATNAKLPTVTLENTGGENFLWCGAFTADRRRVIGGQWGGAIHLWDAETGKVIQNYLGHTRRITSVALSPDEKRFASTSDDGTVRLWDVESEKELLCLNGHEKGIGAPNENEHSVRSVAFSPDGSWILSGGWDGTVRLWDTKTGKELRRYLGHTEGVRCVAISPDGRLAASASDDKTIRLWQLPP